MGPASLTPCAYRKSNRGILVMQSAQDRTRDNVSDPLTALQTGASLFNDKWVRVPL